ncbi:MAG: hypothetical protein AMJ66_00570 [Betaproteobacteria bacterium SG8_40]|jgi:YHS domain-containing protein|nr:MAG: hypothetical protein AMJ66_00570 [Betaproteobacteria bacterium SG8_40]
MKSRKLLLSVALIGIASVSHAAEVEGEYDNLCVTGLSMGKEVETDCSVNVEMDGVTYCFSSAKAKAVFDKDPEGTIAKADKTFEKLSQ